MLFVTTLPVWLFAVQTETKQFERELDAGKQAAGQGDYPEALGHFTKANNLREDKCSECLVWLARIEMAKGNLRQALDWTEKASASAAGGPERASAQLYLGIVLTRQGNLGQAETAFKAASAANPACVECKFNLGFVLLKEAKDNEGVAVLKTVVSQFADRRWDDHDVATPSLAADFNYAIFTSGVVLRTSVRALAAWRCTRAA